MASYSRVHSHDQGYYSPQHPGRAHHQNRMNNHGYSALPLDRFDNIPLEEQGMRYRRQAEIEAIPLPKDKKCCLAKPSNAISLTSFLLGAASTAAHFVLPKVSSLATNATVIAAEKPLLYGGIGGMVLGVAIQLGKLCSSTSCNGPVCIDPCGPGPAPDCSGCGDLIGACCCCPC